MNDSSPIQARQIEGNAIRATLVIRIQPEMGEATTKRRYRGEVYGPLAGDRTTLPASYPLPEFSEDDEVRAVVTDPCFWSPDAPLEYEIVLTPIGEDGDVLRTTIRLRTRSEMA